MHTHTYTHTHTMYHIATYHGAGGESSITSYSIIWQSSNTAKHPWSRSQDGQEPLQLCVLGLGSSGAGRGNVES